jgi:thiazole synthase ThiGH ThiG subunit
VSDFTWTVLPLCADDAVCCPSLEGLGGECLAVLAASYASDTADPDSAEMAEWM